MAVQQRQSALAGISGTRTIGAGRGLVLEWVGRAGLVLGALALAMILAIGIVVLLLGIGFEGPSPEGPPLPLPPGVASPWAMTDSGAWPGQL